MEETLEKAPINKKKKKEPWEIVLKDRFLKNEKPDNIYLVALLYFIVFFLSFLLVFVCFFQLCTVRGSSMESTLHDRDNVLLLKASSYKRGDIVVISKEGSDKKSTNIIKRIIAVEGDELYFDASDEQDVMLWLKKKGESEFHCQDKDEKEYIKEPMKKKDFPPDFAFGKNNVITIEENSYYVMGDNRNDSVDSRYEDSQYTTSNIYGKSILVVKEKSVLAFFLKLLYHENNATDA